MKDNHLSREKLYAYDDGLLPAVERRAVERHLETCAACQEQLAHSTAIVRALKQQLGGTRAPFSLRTAVRGQIGEYDTRRAIGLWPAARVLVLASLVGAFMLAAILAVVSMPRGAPPLAAQLAEAHRRLAQEPEGAQIQGGAAVLSPWLEEQLHERISLPTPEGFSIIAGRLETIDGQLAAHVLYRQENAASMSLLIWRGAIATTLLVPREHNGGHFYFGTQGAQTVVLWLDHDLAYACVGEAAPEAMLDLASRVWRNDVN